MAPEANNGYKPRLKTAYFEKVVPDMMTRHGWKNRNEVPRFKKVVVNIGVSEARENVKALDMATEELSAITGQKPEVRRAKKSISNFKLRQGMPIGLRVTLRGDRMFEFLDRLISMAIPRLRDFQGLNPKQGFDGRGNYNLGLTEQYLFPEVNLDKSDKPRGMNITIVTNAGKDDSARDLLISMGMPFRPPEKPKAKPEIKAPEAV